VTSAGGREPRLPGAGRAGRLLGGDAGQRGGRAPAAQPGGDASFEITWAADPLGARRLFTETLAIYRELGLALAEKAGAIIGGVSGTAWADDQ
jgi:hypothetical protein